MDGNLLLSVLGGLGRVDTSDDGLETYVKDDDCLGEHTQHRAAVLACLNLAWPAFISTACTDTLRVFLQECLKDLQRFLRHDDASTRDAFFVLGKAKTTRTHLIPLITRYAEDVDIVYNARELAHPVRLCPATCKQLYQGMSDEVRSSTR